MNRIYIELGCGENPITESTPDLSHRKLSYRLDIIAFQHVELVGNSISLPLRDETVSGFVSQHLIEHHSHRTFDVDPDGPVYGGQLLEHLKEVYRCLCVGGFYETMCPNFAYIASTYMNWGNVSYGRSLQLMQWAMGGQRNEWDFHYCLLDFNLLRHFAELAGFSCVDLLHPFDWFGLHVKMEK